MRCLMRWHFLGLLAVAGPTWADEGPANPLSGLMKGEIHQSYKLPGADLIMVQSGDKVYFTTPNARYLIRGQLYDTWHGKFLSSIDQAKALGDTINLKKLPVSIDKDLEPFYLGTGEKEAVVFLDPHCPYCHKLLKQMEQLRRDFRFKLILIPALGDQSARTIRLLRCGTEGKDRNEEVVTRLIQADWKGLKDEQCDLNPFLKSAVLAKILGVEGVPFLIAPDGRVLRGYTEDLEGFLREKNAS